MKCIDSKSSTGVTVTNKLKQISEHLSAGKEALELLKRARDLLQEGENQAAIDKKIRATEKTLIQCSLRLAKLTKTRRKPGFFV